MATAKSATADLEPKTDKGGRLLDKLGKPLRDRRSRTYGTAAFMGRPGKPHPKTERLEERQKAFDNDKQRGNSRKRPGSLNK